MPRDKTDTHRRLLSSIKQEFLKKGYEKTSLQNIAASIVAQLSRQKSKIFIMN